MNASHSNNGNALLLFSDKNRMTSVERSGPVFEIKPPVSILFIDCNPSREIVVLVAITPAILVSLTIEIYV